MARGMFTMAIFILLTGLAPAEEGAGVRADGLGGPGGPIPFPQPPHHHASARGATDWQAASSAAPPAAGSGRSWRAC